MTYMTNLSHIVFTTGYAELGNYWSRWPFEGDRQYGGTERMLIEFAKQYAADGHRVTVRLPYDTPDRVEWGVLWIGQESLAVDADLLLCWDDFSPRDTGRRRILFNARSDPPRHTDFDEIVFFSKYQARVLGHPDSPAVGGGVDLADYKGALPRLPRRVICTSSPDRCPQASAIGAGFDFVHTYKPVGGVGTEYPRPEFIRIQQTAMVQIYPLDPRRPSDMYSMSVLEALAAGTPVITTDADAMPECWSDCTIQLPLPIDLGTWTETIERALLDRSLWQTYSLLGRKKARELTWPKQAAKFLQIAMG